MRGKNNLRGKRHGMYNSPEYTSWRSLSQRCENPNNKDYPNYGARGIKVCRRWKGKDGFKNFYKDMGPRPKNCSLDRINVNGNYSPSNCRWATAKTQANNVRNIYSIVDNRNKMNIDIARKIRKDNNIGLKVKDISKKYNVSHKTVYRVIQNKRWIE